MAHNSRPLRFLLLHSRTGGGHLRVARTVAEALRERYGDLAQVTLVDVLAEYAPWPLCRAPDWYPIALRGGGRIYGWGFRILNGRRRVWTLCHLVWPVTYPRALRLFREHPADLIVSFHPVPVYTLSRALEWAGRSTPFVAVGTDLVVMHAAWAAPGVYRYLVATEAAREQLQRHGIEPERIEVTGLPVGSQFQRIATEDPIAVRRRLGLEPERPTVLLMGGGVGFEPLEAVARAVAAATPTAQLILIAGQNERLRARLLAIPWPGPTRVEGFVENIHEWMRAADVLVTKAGPTTIAEALTVGIPMVLWGAIPAQETPNVQLVVQAGAGIWAPGPERTATAVARLVANPTARRVAAGEARRLASPEAARRVADILWETASHRPPAPQSSTVPAIVREQLRRWRRTLQDVAPFLIR
ncbi:MAG: glycosyltransferase [Anaerolineae bacterium]|nr:glycosyltransferase [Anaerolineae bacterium]MDW8067322.1 glycosyltransferase [Anaerolineae bacterium]